MICFVNPFIKTSSVKKAIFFIIILCGCFSFSISQPVKIVYNKTSPQANYAAETLKKAVIASRYTLSTSKASIVITISTNFKRLDAEEYVISKDRNNLYVAGGTQRGMIYGCLSLAEQLRNGSRLEAIKTQGEKPHYSFRAIKF